MKNTSICPECWAKIGSFGDRSCYELSELIHCSNCKTYTFSGREIFNRKISNREKNEWTENISQVKETNLENKFSILIWQIGDEIMAINTSSVVAVIKAKEIHNIPHKKSSHLLGLVNFMGELLLCVSLVSLMKIDTPKMRFNNFIILKLNESDNLVFPVNEIMGIHNFNFDKIQESPSNIRDFEDNISLGILEWNDKNIEIIDGKKLLDIFVKNLR